MKEIGPSGIEAYFKREVKKAGGMTEKHISPGKRAVPDQLVTWDDGLMHLVELKAPRTRGTVAVAQKRDHKRRWDRGVRVYVLHTKEAVDGYISFYSVNGYGRKPQQPNANQLLTTQLIGKKITETLQSNLLIRELLGNN